MSTRQAPLSMGFSKQEYWSGLPFPFPGDLPNPGLFCLLHWQVGSFPLVPPGLSSRVEQTHQSYVPEPLQLHQPEAHPERACCLGVHHSVPRALLWGVHVQTETGSGRWGRSDAFLLVRKCFRPVQHPAVTYSLDSYLGDRCELGWTSWKDTRGGIELAREKAGQARSKAHGGG